MDDSAIVIKTDEGLIIISGCSHAGICNIINYAKEVCKEDKILVLLGGFHLFDKKVTDKTVDFIKDQDIKQIYPAHCLDEYAFSEFEKIGAKRIRTLQVLVI
jgi:7,8-dihydropterin-6-yl-methyl-4-(beta-D-ribofuranosyl)aminobenzene 5'-phosphate synthase